MQKACIYQTEGNPLPAAVCLLIKKLLMIMIIVIDKEVSLC